MATMTNRWSTVTTMPISFNASAPSKKQTLICKGNLYNAQRLESKRRRMCDFPLMGEKGGKKKVIV